MEKRWRCTVCGYVHRSETAPDVCPVCGVGPDKFALMEEDGDGEPASAAETGLLKEMIDSFVPHAVMAHFPNALLPTLALFLLLYLVGVRTLDHGVYLLLGLIPVTAIATLGTGVYSWKKHYAGARTKVFHRKLILGVSLVLICAQMLVLRYSNPELLSAMSGTTWFFLALCGAALFCVTMLGHYGGMLVFGGAAKDQGTAGK